MSDLPNLLRVIADNRGYAPGFPDVWEAIREAADIIERQQQINGPGASGGDGLSNRLREALRRGTARDADINEAAALIERQQQEIQELREAGEKMIGAWQGQQQEIERLRQSEKDGEDTLRLVGVEMEEQRENVERWARIAQDQSGTIGRLQAEIERLREYEEMFSLVSKP